MNSLRVVMLDIVTSIGIIGTLGLGIYVYRRQMNAQIYLEYTKRCDQIMRCFPREVRLNLVGAAPGSVDQLLLLRYLNLCSEEFYLWKNWYLSGRIWRIWEGEIERFLCSPLARVEWQELQKEFNSFAQFQKYVDTVQNTDP